MHQDATNEFHTFFKYNHETLDANGEATISRVSRLKHHGMSFDGPQESKFNVRETQLLDQTALFQFGQTEVQPFYGITREVMGITWGPLARFSVYLQSDITRITRKTDSLLDVLSSMGGLVRALTVFGSILAAPVNGYALKSLLTLNLVRIVPSQSSNSNQGGGEKSDNNDTNARQEDFKSKYLTSQHDTKRTNLLQNLIKNFSKDEQFQPVSFFKSILQRFKAPKRHRLFEESQNKLRKELDL